MKPYISIIVPVYNEENHLRQCIDSIISQSLDNIEIIIVDDGSKDKSGVICDDYAAADRRIKVIHKKNEGLGMARNAGMKAACGEFIAFVDSDDYVSAEMYEKLYKKAKQYNADTCLCGFQSFDKKEKKKYWPLKLNKDIYVNGEIKDNILLNMIGTKPEDKEDDIIGMSVWKGIYSSAIIFENNIKFVSERKFISEDIIFNIDYMKNSKICTVVEEPYYHYRDTEGSLTNAYLKERFNKEKELYLELIKKLKKLKIYNKAELRLKRMFIARSRICILHEAQQKRKTKEVLERIKVIVNDKELQHVLNKYPIKKLPVKKRIFAYAEKLKLYYVILFMSRICLSVRGKYND